MKPSLFVSNITSTPYCHTGRPSKPHRRNVSPPPGDFTKELIIALVAVTGNIALDEGKSTASYWVLFNWRAPSGSLTIVRASNEALGMANFPALKELLLPLGRVGCTLSDF